MLLCIDNAAAGNSASTLPGRKVICSRPGTGRVAAPSRWRDSCVIYCCGRANVEPVARLRDG